VALNRSIILLIIIIKIIDFLSETFFPYFFHVHLNILDKVVSSLYGNFGTPVCKGEEIIFKIKSKIKLENKYN
jgi:hypothetical protein